MVLSNTWLVRRANSILAATITLGTLMTSAAADVINHNGRKIGLFKPGRF